MQINELRQRYMVPFEGPKVQNENNPFADVLQGFVKDVNADQLNSSQMTNDFMNGKNVELHEVMIAGEKAKTSLELLMEIRNKTLYMY
ncbi:MAG: flagellar hook-basal body complex protein FliE, partial [Ignavibacteriales bacterium]|nr:flagellar hook-basal body complex protein FliE [Ignavibacteriales bacterium]